MFHVANANCAISLWHRLEEHPENEMLQRIALNFQEACLNACDMHQLGMEVFHKALGYQGYINCKGDA